MLGGFERSDADLSLSGQSTDTQPQQEEAQQTTTGGGTPGLFSNGQTEPPDVMSTSFVAPTRQEAVMKVITKTCTRHQVITAMKEYENKSLEELRVEDYQANRKDPRPTTSTDLFGAKAAIPQTSLFETGTGSSFGLFGERQSTPTATATSTNLFSSQAIPGRLFESGTIPPFETSGFQFNPSSQLQLSIFGANNNNGAATTTTATQPLSKANPLMSTATAPPTDLFGTPNSFPFFGFPSLLNFMDSTALSGFQQQLFPSAVEHQKYFPGYVPFATTPYRHNLNSPTTTTPEAETGASSSKDESGAHKKKRGRGRPTKFVIPDYITVLGGHPPMYQCNVCRKKFKTKVIIKSHEFCQNGEKPKPYICGECGHGFVVRQNYEYHLRTHTTGERRLSLVPTQSFEGLSSHIPVHSKEPLNLQVQRQTSDPHSCDRCSRKFTRNWDLRRHIVVCNGERPFKCGICKQTFNRKDHLNDHIKNTHNQLKDVANQLAKEAVTEYFKSNAKSQQQLQDIPTSEVNPMPIGSEFYDWMTPSSLFMANLENGGAGMRMSSGGVPGDSRDAAINENEMPIDMRTNIFELENQSPPLY